MLDIYIYLACIKKKRFVTTEFWPVNGYENKERDEINIAETNAKKTQQYRDKFYVFSYSAVLNFLPAIVFSVHYLKKSRIFCFSWIYPILTIFFQFCGNKIIFDGKQRFWQNHDQDLKKKQLKIVKSLWCIVMFLRWSKTETCWEFSNLR